MTASGSNMPPFPVVHRHKVQPHCGGVDDDPASVVMATSFMADTPSSALVEPDPHSLLSSSLTVPQSSLTVNNDEDSTEGIDDPIDDGGGDLTGSEFSQQLAGSGDESDTLDAISSLALQQSSLFLVNLSSRTQSQLGTLGGGTAAFMPVLVLGGQKLGENPQLLRLRDIAHASLICATQESIARTYNAAPPKPVEKREFKCEECSRIFKSSSHYRYHMETHKGNKMLKCPVNGCNRSFSWPANLKYHVRTHANDRPYPCSIEGCGKTFFTVQALNVHTRIHTGTKPFKCAHDGCNKSFTTQGNLKNHCRTHTGERPFSCDFEGCLQKFAEMSSLKKHKLTHTGEKPYECEICGRVFSQSASRNTHKRRHHNSIADQKVSSVLDGDHDTMRSGLPSKGCGTIRHHTRTKPQFTIDDLKSSLSESPVGDIDSNEVPSASCRSQDTDDISLSHSLLQGLGPGDSSVPISSSLEKDDSQDESSSEFVLSQHPPHSLHTMVSGTHHPDVQEEGRDDPHLHHHLHPSEQQPSPTDRMVYDHDETQSLLQSDLEESGSQMMGVAGDHVIGVSASHVMGVSNDPHGIDVSTSHLIGVSEGHVIGVSDSSHVIGVSDSHVMGVSDGHVMGVPDSHVMGVSDSDVMGVSDGHVIGVSDSHVMGVSDEHVMGVSDSHVMGVSDGHVMGVSDGHVIGVSDSHVMGVSDGHVIGVSDSHVMGVSDEPPSVGQDLQYPEDIWGSQEHMSGPIMECT